MFRGVVDRASHELGLLVTFSGSSPALGSIIVREEDGHYIGKVDAVLGSTDSPLVHIAHLDRKQDNDQFLGSTVTVRAKKEREDRPQRREFREERPSRDRERSFDRRGGRDGEGSLRPPRVDGPEQGHVQPRGLGVRSAGRWVGARTGPVVQICLGVTSVQWVHM